MALLVMLAVFPAQVQIASADDVTLSWTAPGDDGSVGTAFSYELRVSPDTAITSGNWGTTGRVVTTAQPLAAGNRQSTVVTNLSPDTTYWFAIKTTDDAGNQSNISNVFRWDWVLDTTAPAAPLGVSAALQGGGTVQVSWTANSEADLSGYVVYRATSASGPFVQLNGGLVSGTTYVDANVPIGINAAWYQVSAQDVSGNLSARSAAAQVDLTTVGTQGTGLWTMETGYPNPSGNGAVVRLPVVVPPGAGGSAVLEITSSSGQRVRRQTLTLSAGGTELQWDGKNDAGREVAPGTYTAWLITGGARMSVRLVRVP